MASTPASHQAQAPSAPSDQNNNTSFNTLAYELQAEVIKAFVWQSLPFSDAITSLKSCNSYAYGLSGLELLCNHGVAQHLLSAMQRRMKYEQAELARLEDLRQDLTYTFWGQAKPDGDRGWSAMPHGANGEACFCRECNHRVARREKQLVAFLASALPNWHAEYGESWYIEHIKAGRKYRGSNGCWVKIDDFVASALGEWVNVSNHYKAVLDILREHVGRLRRLIVASSSSNTLPS